MNRARRAPQALIIDNDAQRSLRLRSHHVLASLDAVSVAWSPEVVPLVELLQPRVLIASAEDRYSFALRQICERMSGTTIIVIQQNAGEPMPRAHHVMSEPDAVSLLQSGAPRISGGPEIANASLLRLGSTVVDLDRGHVIRNDRSEILAPCERAVLAALVKRAGECVSRETLLEEVWKGKATSSRVVDRQVFLLRKRLEENPRRPRYILTAFEKGYKLIRD